MVGGLGSAVTNLREGGRVTKEGQGEEKIREVLGRKRVMPLVSVKIIEGVFSEGQKQDIVRKLTDTMVTIEGENMRQVTWVVVEEVKSGDWGMGGQPLTTSDVKALAAGGR
jgi:4-oxalocrotonate tautomerase